MVIPFLGPKEQMGFMDMEEEPYMDMEEEPYMPEEMENV